MDLPEKRRTTTSSAKMDNNGHSLMENGSSQKEKVTNPSNKTNKTVYLVFVSLLIDLLAFTMILPLLPSLLEHYRVNDKDGLYSYLSDSVKYCRELIGAPEK